MPPSDSERRIRDDARAYETGLPPEQRKRLGQYFTGLPLGKLLAHLALRPDTRSVLDPMAGHGDLLDATWEAASECGARLAQLDGIEIDERTAAACEARLAAVAGKGPPNRVIVPGDAFDPATVQKLAHRAYDLVITNPPYVRYQSRKKDSVRAGLAKIIESQFLGEQLAVWQTLTEAYSGLADLSVPALLHAASFVREGGRLALVVPATWRSRDYADVIRYLLLRCFALECIVEDTQPGWFSDALVRTHLIVARRLHAEEIAPPIRVRTDWPRAIWLQVSPIAAQGESLVGASFSGKHPEAAFAAWVHADCSSPKAGLSVRPFVLQDEWNLLRTRIHRRRWYQHLEDADTDLPLFAAPQTAAAAVIPEALRDLLPKDLLTGLSTLQEAGIEVGQGLRTGCNGFFYVTARSSPEANTVRIEASSLFDRCQLTVPGDTVRPVVRRQSELAAVENGELPLGRVLDLRKWILPEDRALVEQARGVYAAAGEQMPKIMPTELACLVRRASTTPAKGEGRGAIIPELSAVRTNVRLPKIGSGKPRFWYMLPDFAPRHLPAAFAPRINHGTVWTESNLNPTVLIDANFSTFWPSQADWTPQALKALLNSAWCRAFMEALGTPFGGGALKLEATHLRHMPVPVLSASARRELDALGQHLRRDTVEVQACIDKIVFNAVLRAPALSHEEGLVSAMTERARSMSCARQRAA